MKSLQESLFDSDLVSKDIGALHAITNYLGNYLDGNTGGHQWVSTILKIIDGISYKRPAMHMVSPKKVEKMEKDELYVNIDPHIYKQIVLIGWGLGDRDSSIPTIVRLSYSDGLKNICADLYRDETSAYKNVLSSFKYNLYKLDKKDIDSFKKEVLDKIEIIF